MSAAQRPTRFKSRFANPRPDDEDDNDESETLLARDGRQPEPQQDEEEGEERDSLLEERTGEDAGTREMGRRVSPSASSAV